MQTSQRAWVVGIVVLLAASALVGRAQNVGSGQVPVEPPTRPRDPARELALKINGSFTLASVGDVMIRRPASMLDEPAFQSAIKLLRDADIAVGNMEGNLADIPKFEGPLRGMMGSKEVATDLKAMGFDMMNRANNHIFDSDREGLETTAELLTAAGIVHAGTGKNLEDARAPQFLDTPKGRIAIVGMHTPNGDPTRAAASEQEGNVGGRPGLSPLRYTTYYTVNQEQLDAIKKIRASVYTPPTGTTNATKLRDNEPADRVQFLDVWYKLGATPGTKTFEMNKDDLTGILRSIRNGKALSDFLIATIHAHQGPIVAQQWLFEDQPPDFLIDLAHKAIDNGADAFVGHGPHLVRGIEVYKGKPIFYGLGEFFYQWHMDATLMSGSFNRPLANDGQVDALLQVSQNWKAVNYESVISVSRYDKGQLSEIRLYPTDGRFDGPVSMLGIPRSSPPEIAARTLGRIQKLSTAFGTTVAIENNVGIVRVRPKSTSQR